LLRGEGVYGSSPGSQHLFFDDFFVTLRAVRILPVLVLSLVASCHSHEPSGASSAPKASAPDLPKVIGVNPRFFDCEKFLPKKEIDTLAGVALISSPMLTPTPPGAATPCAYAMPIPDAGPIAKAAPPKKKGEPDAGAPPTMYFQYGIDCRGAALDDAQRAFGRTQTDPGVTAVSAGKEAVDDARGQLVMVDDDTPCEVRLVAPDAAMRLQLAKIIAAKLTPVTAPTGVIHR
jgi:hypothetical protein